MRRFFLRLAKETNKKNLMFPVSGIFVVINFFVDKHRQLVYTLYQTCF
jgi:hypothetical protein